MGSGSRVTRFDLILLRSSLSPPQLSDHALIWCSFPFRSLFFIIVGEGNLGLKGNSLLPLQTGSGGAIANHHCRVLILPVLLRRLVGVSDLLL